MYMYVSLISVRQTSDNKHKKENQKNAQHTSRQKPKKNILLLYKAIPFHSIVLFQATRPIQTKQRLHKKTENQYKEQEAQLSPRDRAMRRVNWNLANCHATVQKLLIRQVLTKSMVWSWRFRRRQCVIDNVHSTMTRPSRLPLSQVS